jgi:hypothetical protein
LLIGFIVELDFEERLRTFLFLRLFLFEGVHPQFLKLEQLQKAPYGVQQRQMLGAAIVVGHLNSNRITIRHL